MVPTNVIYGNNFLVFCPKNKYIQLTVTNSNPVSLASKDKNKNTPAHIMFARDKFCLIRKFMASSPKKINNVSCKLETYARVSTFAGYIIYLFRTAGHKR